MRQFVHVHTWHAHGLQPAQHAQLGLWVAQAVEDHYPYTQDVPLQENRRSAAKLLISLESTVDNGAKRRFGVELGRPTFPP